MLQAPIRSYFRYLYNCSKLFHILMPLNLGSEILSINEKFVYIYNMKVFWPESTTRLVPGIDGC